MATRAVKRVVLTGANQPLELWERPVPAPDPGGVIVRVSIAGVCGTDVHLWRGDLPLPNPIVLGHEGIGTIEELGSKAITDYAGVPIRLGDRVYWQPVRQCHHCYYCTVAKDFSLCDNAMEGLFRHANEPPSGCYAEYSWLPEGMAFYRIPDDTPSEAIIAFGCAMPTILQGIERLGGIALNQAVVVQGCGPVGLAATFLARLSGAREVIVIGAPPARLEMARRLGATTTIDLTKTSEADRLEQIRDLTDGHGPEVVIEAAGHLSAFPEGVKLVAKNGRYLVVGLWSAPGTVPFEPRYINNNNIRIVGTALGQPSHLYGAIQVARAHHRDFPLAEAVTHRYGLGEAQKALDSVARLETIKAVIIPSS
ncbi:MAG: zinc-binding dehydrogenase [Candidatus Binataceae bacterium]|nr:zinc-binding dehydrogenase [Candidatus Binataceae bacterium]